MADYPVIFDISPPEKFQRPHLVIRVLLLVVLNVTVIGNVVGWLLGLVYLIIPILSAIFVSQKGGEKFLAEDGPRFSGGLRWLLALYAYLWLLTDRFPTQSPETILRFEVQTSGKPTMGSALLRLIYSIPSALVLLLLTVVGFLLWLVAAVFVLFQENYPPWIYGYIRGILRWQARLLGYHASLVERYPPFALDMGAEAAPA